MGFRPDWLVTEGHRQGVKFVLSLEPRPAEDC